MIAVTRVLSALFVPCLLIGCGTPPEASEQAGQADVGSTSERLSVSDQAEGEHAVTADGRRRADLSYWGPVVDVQAHAMMPGPGVQAAKAALVGDPSVEEQTKQQLSEIYDEMADSLASPLRLEALGTEGIQIITAQMGFPPGLPAGALIGMTSAQNQWLAQSVASEPHFVGIATVPPPTTLAAQGMAAAGVAACRVAITELGLKGMLLSAQYDGVFLGDPVYAPYFALAEELGVPVIVHPAISATGWNLVPRRIIPVGVAFMNDQRLTVVDLIKAGVLENHPQLRVVVTHVGGGFLATLGRLDALDERFPAEHWYIDRQGQRALLPHPVSYYARKLYYDINNDDPEDIALAVWKVGARHLLVGTDFPFFSPSVTRRALGLAPISHSDKRAIAYGNAIELFGLTE